MTEPSALEFADWIERVGVSAFNFEYGVSKEARANRVAMVVAALRGAPPAPQPEPVAWRHKLLGDGYQITQQRDIADLWRERIGDLVEPLYAAPQPAVSPSLEQIARVLAYEDSRQEILATSDESELHHAGDGNWKDWLPHAKAMFANFFAPVDQQPAVSPSPRGDTCFIERSEVREILLTSSEISSDSTRLLLAEVDALPIFVASDFTSQVIQPSDLKEVLANVRAGIEKLKGGCPDLPIELHRACQALSHMVTDEERHG